MFGDRNREVFVGTKSSFCCTHILKPIRITLLILEDFPQQGAVFEASSLRSRKWPFVLFFVIVDTKKLFWLLMG